jgi:hypothetical protein
MKSVSPTAYVMQSNHTLHSMPDKRRMPGFTIRPFERILWKGSKQKELYNAKIFDGAFRSMA